MFAGPRRKDEIDLVSTLAMPVTYLLLNLVVQVFSSPFTWQHVAADFQFLDGLM